MRKFMNTSYSTEGYKDLGSLSIEEEEVIVAEADQAGAEAIADQAEAERSLDVVDAMEDMADILAESPSLTEPEAQLAETLGNMANAGSQEQPDVEPIVPSLESYVGKGRYSVEGIRETIRTIWQNILAFVKRIWKKITDFFYKIAGKLPRMRKEFEDLKRKARDTSGLRLKDNEKKFSLNSGVATLSVGHKALTSGAELIRHGEFFATLIDSAMSSSATDAKTKMIEAITDFANDFDPEKGPGAFTTHAGKAAGEFKNAVFIDSGVMHAVSLVNSDNYTYTKSDEFFGSNVLLSRAPKNILFTGDSTHVLHAAAKINLEIVSSDFNSNSGKELPTSCDFTILSASEQEKVCEIAIRLIETCDQYSRGKSVKELDKKRKALESATDKLKTRGDKLANSDDAAERAFVSQFRAIADFNTSASRWTINPVLPLYRQAMHVLSALKHIVAASQARYTSARD